MTKAAIATCSPRRRHLPGPAAWVRVGAASDAVFAVFVAAKRVATMAAVASVVSFFNHVGPGVLALTRTIVRGDHGLSLEAAS